MNIALAVLLTVLVSGAGGALFAVACAGEPRWVPVLLSAAWGFFVGTVIGEKL